MENCEAMTSSPHSFAYSYRLVKKCFLKICETSKCHNFLIFQPIFIRFSLLCLKIFTLSSEIKLNLLWSSSLSLRLFLFSYFRERFHKSILPKIFFSVVLKEQSDEHYMSHKIKQYMNNKIFIIFIVVICKFYCYCILFFIAYCYHQNTKLMFCFVFNTNFGILITV